MTTKYQVSVIITGGTDSGKNTVTRLIHRLLQDNLVNVVSAPELTSPHITITDEELLHLKETKVIIWERNSDTQPPSNRQN